MGLEPQAAALLAGGLDKGKLEKLHCSALHERGPEARCILEQFIGLDIRFLYLESIGYYAS
jgi:hypothetical protein